MTGCWVSGPSPRNTTPHPCMLKVPPTLLLTRSRSSRGAACPPAQGVPPPVGQQAQLLEQAAKGNKSCPEGPGPPGLASRGDGKQVFLSVSLFNVHLSGQGPLPPNPDATCVSHCGVTVRWRGLCPLL